MTSQKHFVQILFPCEQLVNFFVIFVIQLACFLNFDICCCATPKNAKNRALRFCAFCLYFLVVSRLWKVHAGSLPRGLWKRAGSGATGEPTSAAAGTMTHTHRIIVTHPPLVPIVQQNIRSGVGTLVEGCLQYDPITAGGAPKACPACGEVEGGGTGRRFRQKSTPSPGVQLTASKPVPAPSPPNQWVSSIFQPPEGRRDGNGISLLAVQWRPK